MCSYEMPIELHILGPLRIHILESYGRWDTTPRLLYILDKNMFKKSYLVIGLQCICV